MAQEKRTAGDLSEEDIKDFRDFVEKYKEKIYRVAYGVLHNREDAMDVSQEVFVKVYTKGVLFDEKIKPASWIYRVAMNLAIDVLRKRKRAREIELSDNIECSGSEDPKKNTEQREMMRIFYKALAEMDRKHSRVLVLREIEGLDYEAIAGTLRCSVGTVMSRLHYARKKILNRMEGFLNEA